MAQIHYRNRRLYIAAGRNLFEFNFTVDNNSSKLKLCRNIIVSFKDALASTRKEENQVSNFSVEFLFMWSWYLASTSCSSFEANTLFWKTWLIEEYLKVVTNKNRTDQSVFKICATSKRSYIPNILRFLDSGKHT